MPTVLRIKGYRLFFFSSEGLEPRHIHIAQAEKYAKFWLRPVSLARNRGFRSRELSEIRALVEEHKEIIEERWDEHFASQD